MTVILLLSLAICGVLVFILFGIALFRLDSEVAALRDHLKTLDWSLERDFAELRADLAHLRAHVARRGLEALNDDETSPSLLN